MRVADVLPVSSEQFQVGMGRGDAPTLPPSSLGGLLTACQPPFFFLLKQTNTMKESQITTLDHCTTKEQAESLQRLLADGWTFDHSQDDNIILSKPIGRWANKTIIIPPTGSPTPSPI